MSRLDLVAGLRELARRGDLGSPEVDRLLAELDAALGPEERTRLENALRDALPELRQLRDRAPELLSQPVPEGTASALPPDKARGLIAELAEAWGKKDSARLDAILSALEATLPGSREAERRRIESDVKASISASFKGFSLPALGDAGKS